VRLGLGEAGRRDSKCNVYARASQAGRRRFSENKSLLSRYWNFVRFLLS
jgi:hypothetical protein